MQPLRRTPLAQSHSQRAASFIEQSGWQRADRFTTVEVEERAAREGVVLADVSWLAKFDVKGNGSSLDGEAITPASFWSLARGHGLVTCEPDEATQVVQAIREHAAAPSDGGSNGCCHVTDATSVYAALLLAGPLSREVLYRLTDLDVSDAALPRGACAQTELAHTHAIVLRPDAGELPGFLLLVGWEYGQYVWDAILEAGECLGIEPMGLQAVRRLQP